MKIELTQIIVSFFTLLGIVGTAFFKWLQAKKKSADLHNNIIELLNSTIETNEKILTVLELKFRNSVNENSHEIMEIKKLAWEKQQTMLVNEVKSIIRANGLHNRDVTIIKIKSSLTQVIEIIDIELNNFNISKFMAPTKEKIEFVLNSNFANVLYKIILENKNDFEKLELNIRSVGKQILQAVKNEFYNSNGRVKQ